MTKTPALPARSLMALHAVLTDVVKDRPVFFMASRAGCRLRIMAIGALGILPGDARGGRHLMAGHAVLVVVVRDPVLRSGTILDVALKTIRRLRRQAGMVAVICPNQGGCLVAGHTVTVIVVNNPVHGRWLILLMALIARRGVRIIRMESRATGP